jgi:hypothetical protein
MFDSLLKDVEVLTKDKAFLTVEDIATILNCEPKVIYNWTKRPNPKKRPPKLCIGKSLRFPKTEFVRWLANEGSEGAR